MPELEVNKYEFRIDERTWQRFTGVVEDKTIHVEILPEVVKKINEVTDGKVYFYRRSNTVYVDYAVGYSNVRDEVRKQIDTAILRKVQENVNNIDNIVISTEDIDFKKIREIYEKTVEEIKRRKEEEKRIQELRERIKQIVDSRDYFKDVRFYSNYARVTINLGDSEVDEFEVPYTEEGVKKLEEYDYIKALTKYIEKLREKIAELEKENQELKSELESEDEDF